MFTTEELQAIDRKYFTVIVADAYDVTLISNNTRHVWYIHNVELKDRNLCLVYPDCPNLTEGRYCPEHQTKVNSEYEKYGRDPRTKKRYGRAWKRIRDKYVMEHPFCELCFQRGIMVETEEGHHKKPMSEGGTHDRSNLIALCKSCYSRIHANRGDRWHNKTAAP